MNTASRSDFLHVRGLRYHVRRWGDPAKPLLVLGHGWLDVSATFQDLVQPLLEICQVACPDWRGLGHTQWPQDGYWFQDYVADLDVIIDHYAADTPIWLAGHSMGAQVASLYAGLRPNRVRKLVCIDGPFVPDMPPEIAPRKFTRWLDQWRQLPRQKTYDSFATLAERIRVQHPQLSSERALFIARCWGTEDGRGRIRLLADPKHRMHGPTLYRLAESKVIWRQITAPTLFIDGGQSPLAKSVPAAELAQRRACFSHHQQVVIAEAGHMMHFDAPDATGRLIADFLAASE